MQVKMRKKAALIRLAYLFCTIYICYALAAPSCAIAAMPAACANQAAPRTHTSEDSPGVYPAPPEVGSDYFILMDADSGAIIYESNSDMQCYPASVTKLMTALLVVENCNLSDTLTVSSAAVGSIKYGDANAALKVGEEFTVEQALNIMLIKSANDMAYALGEHVGGSIANFANMMNKKAEELGCTNTHFSNASGLTDVNHYTTAYDMALICQAVINTPAIMNAISYTRLYSVSPTNMTPETRYYKLSHSMLTGSYKYEYCIGGKTGYTDAAGHTLATFAQKDGLRLICVLFQSTDEGRYQDTTALFEYTFNNFKRMNISENEDSFNFNQGLGLAAFGITGKALRSNYGIRLTVPSDDYLIIPDNVDFDDLTKEISYNEGSRTGFADVYYYYGSRLVGSTKLIIPEKTGNTATANGLPYLSDSSDVGFNATQALVGSRYVTINLWLFIGILCTIILFTIILINAKKRRHKLHFD